MKTKREDALIIIGIIFIIIGLLLISNMANKKTTNTNLNNQNYETATFAAGCFWCVESAFENYKDKGVIEVISGYTNGTGENPTYEDYSEKGYIEAVQVTFDPKKISYNDLLEIFWRQFDPTDATGSFNDRGFQYSSGIFYHNLNQKKTAEDSIKKLNNSGIYEKPVVTPIQPFKSFYKAEDYHQDYSKKNPIRYKYYRYASGRDEFREKIWGEDKDYVLPNSFEKPNETELKKILTPLQYEVTQNNGTEPAFNNEYHDNKEEGIYVDVVSGEPLFSSLDKYDSGTGWPSFTKPLEPNNIVTKKDYKLILPRTEVRSKTADSHLGHVFNDGPKEEGGKRYCMNSAALKFISKDKLKSEGYEEYLKLFE